MDYNVCQIIVPDKKGTGFFCKIPIEKDKYSMKTLITNYHVLNKEDIKPNNQIYFITNNNRNNKKKIEMDSYKCSYTNEEYDTTIIEVKKETDDLDSIEYFEVDNKILMEKRDDKFLKDIDTYVIHYPHIDDKKDEQVSHNNGKIKAITKNKDYIILHDCQTYNGSSGAPIIDAKTKKVIGIHKGSKDRSKYNLGTLLNFPIKEFKESNSEKIKKFIEYNLNKKNDNELKKKTD